MTEQEPPLLAEVLAELASLAAEPFDVAELVDLATDRGCRALGCDGAVVLLSVDGERLDAVGSTASAEGVDALLALDSTPCHVAIRSGEVVVFATEDGGDEFKQFAELARRYRVQCALSVPLRHRDRVIGVLCLVRGSNAPFEPATIEGAQQLAVLLASGIVREEAHRAAIAVTAQLQRALDARVVIEQAKGMVAAELQISVDDALERIRPFARRQHLQLADVAADIVSRKLSITLLSTQ